MHPQWVVVDLATLQDINAIRILWTAPYATNYLVQYWTGTDPMHEATKGDWVTFPGGEIRDGKDGEATLQLSRAPMPVRFVRIWMTESSETCDTHETNTGEKKDRRNCLGYAIEKCIWGRPRRMAAFTT